MLEKCCGPLGDSLLGAAGKEGTCMAQVKEVLSSLGDSKYHDTFAYIYAADEPAIKEQTQRYEQAVQDFAGLFGDSREVELFSAPGRTEIGGNHTDHQHGRVVAAGVNLDVIAVASRNHDGVIRIQSKGYPMDTIDLSCLEVQDKEKNKAASLIRGVAARFEQLGYRIGGFDAYTTSNVLKGSGLSSSAAFEVLVGTMLSHLFNDGEVDAVKIAQIGQYAENVYFGKPCGLMDQTASSVGGFVAIDFADPQNPVVEKIDFDFTQSGCALCIVDTGGNHADLTGDYASVPQEMKEVARICSKEVLRDVPEKDFMDKLPEIRRQAGDRAVLRAIHFFRENERAARLAQALREHDFAEFKRLITQSGESSFMYLQNVYTTKNVREQGLSLALALAQEQLGESGACRVHGGGFAGTIQAFVPVIKLRAFKSEMERVFGANTCHVLSIRPVGGIKVTQDQ